jgi:hypothetical protein
MGWVVNKRLRPLYPRERPGAHCTEGCVGPRAGAQTAAHYRTVQPAKRRHTARAIPVHQHGLNKR